MERPNGHFVDQALRAHLIVLLKLNILQEAQLYLYNTENDGLNSIKRLFPELSKATVPLHIEIHKATNNNVYPFWLVLYLRRDAELDDFFYAIGDKNLDKALNIFGGAEHDYGRGQSKYNSIQTESKLLWSLV